MRDKSAPHIMSKALVLAGLPGSGKSVASDVAKIIGIPVVTMGDVIRAETTKRGLDATSKNIGMVAVDLRAKFGEDIVLRKSWPSISDALAHYPLIIIDGMRSSAEEEALIELMGKPPQILAIIASEKARNYRLIERKRSDDVVDKSIDEKLGELPKHDAISERDTRERGWGVESLLQRADFRIENEDSIDSFRTTVKALLEGLNCTD
jgi:dephospho-CoA kinase